MEVYRVKDIILINPQPVVLKNLFAESLMYSNPPLGLGYLASVLRQNGYNVDIYDMGPQKLTVNDIISKIKKEKCSAVGIASIVGNYGNGIRLAKILKDSFPEIKIITGGPHASFIPEEILSKEWVDIVCRFESEETIVEIMDTLSRGDDFQDIKGIAYKDENGYIHINKPRPFIEDLDSIPFPAWDLFQLECYSEPGVVLTGRGCPYSCIFCAASRLSGSRYRIRSSKNVVDEIEYLYEKYNINRIFIADDTFTAIKKHCIRICEEIIERNLDITWEAEVRANTVNNEIAREMSKAGCLHVQIGAESGDNKILKLIEKNITTEMIERAVKIMLSHGISVVCSFIIGHPFDTHETVQKTIDFACKLHRLDPNLVKCKFAFLTPLPGTPIFERQNDFGIKLLSKNWDLYTFYDPIAETKYLNRKDLQNLYLEAWMRYINVEREFRNK